MKTLEILRLKRGWCQFKLATDIAGNQVNPKHKSEVARVCLRGAMVVSIKLGPDGTVPARTEMPVLRALGFRGSRQKAINEAVDWNNSEVRTQTEVVRRVDAAINKLCE